MGKHGIAQDYLIIFIAMNKKVILLVDNRLSEQLLCEPNKSAFRGSAFKATEVDPQEHSELISQIFDEQAFLSQLHDRIYSLEQRVEELQKSSKTERVKRRLRRKANQISKEFQCPHKSCQKLYGSETSLKNHIKIKHWRRG